MKAGQIVGIILIIFGCVSLSYAGITYTHRHKVLQVGSLIATDNEQSTLPLSPVVGGIALVAGLGMVVYRRGI